jgi:hypothetical protein
VKAATCPELLFFLIGASRIKNWEDAFCYASTHKGTATPTALLALGALKIGIFA